MSYKTKMTIPFQSQEKNRLEGQYFLTCSTQEGLFDTNTDETPPRLEKINQFTISNIGKERIFNI